MPRVRFQPLRITKRRWKQPWFAHNDDQYSSLEHDPEKFDDEWEDSSYGPSSSEASSRASSGSYASDEAMLNRKRRSKPATAYAPRRNCNIYFTIILGTTLIIFVLTLIQLHHHSVAIVSSGIYKPTPKPPPWEDFPKLQRYFGGLRSLISGNDNNPEYPGDKQNVLEEAVEAIHNATSAAEDILEERDDSRQSIPVSKVIELEFQSSRKAAAPCYIDEQQTIQVPQLREYHGLVEGFPDQALGTNVSAQHQSTRCSDRFGRLGAYGFGYSQKYGGTGAGLEGDLDGTDDMWKHQTQIDYRTVSWSLAQENCVAANENRFRKLSQESVQRDHSNDELISQTAVLIRKKSDQLLSFDEILSLRALIAESSLATGGIFQVHFLIEVMGESHQFWEDEAIEKRLLDESLPEEFHGMGILWSSQQMTEFYPGLQESPISISAQDSSERIAMMPVQHFAKRHPEFDFLWTWSTDTRYTNHIGELLSRMDEWSSHQPRKEIWERAARFYVPREHGSWNEYIQMIHILSEHGHTNDAETSSSKSIWGAAPPSDGVADASKAIEGTKLQSADAYEWGVDEPADLLTLSPIFDPASVTSWSPSTDVTGYNITTQYPPRRATIGQTLRLSRRLLLAMHSETANGKRHMASEMWPASVALHYGFKAVYVPHATYVDRKWPTDYLSAVLNAGADGGIVGGRSSVFGSSRKAVLDGLSWGSDGRDGGFSRRLWKRWLGYRDETTGEGGEEWELSGEGRMCLPPMLLSGVRNVNLIVEESV